MSDKRSNSRLSTRDCERIDDEHGVKNYKRKDFVPSRTKGAYLWTPEDVRLLDLLASYGAVMEHCWDLPIDALIKCLTDPQQQMDAVSAAVTTPYRARFQLAVTRFTGYKRVFAKCGGGEMVETAYSALFRHATMRGIPQEDQEVVLIDKFFHGRMRSSQTNSSDLHQRTGKGPRVRGFNTVLRDIEAVREALMKPNCIGIVLEKHQGEAGPIFDARGKDSFYREIHTIARQLGKLIVVDEVQSGLYRCGYKMSWMEDGPQYRPDATVLAKILGGGIEPISAIVCNDDFAKAWTPGSDGSTFGGFPPACAAATAVIEYMEQHPELGERSIAVGKRFADKLSGIPHVSVDYRGSMIGVFVESLSSAEDICHDILKAKRGAYLIPGHAYEHGTYIRISPAFKAITDGDIDDICRFTLRPVLEKVSLEIIKGEKW